MATLGAPPVLSTPDTHFFEDPTPAPKLRNAPRLSDGELLITYEIERTVCEIRQGRWRRIALQFPDEMLVDAPRVFAALNRRLKEARKSDAAGRVGVAPHGEAQVSDSASGKQLEDKVGSLEISEARAIGGAIDDEEERLYILADTSYGSCCIDEIAAEHIDASVIVHYGRTCLSPTARLPVIYVFTAQPLPLEPVIRAFQETFPSMDEKVVLMADVTYANHVQRVYDALCEVGYTNVFRTAVIHSPGSLLPNRTVPAGVEEGKEGLGEYELFHISEPPTSLLLTLSSRLASIYIYPTAATYPQKPILTTTTATLRRRYALVTSLTTVPIFGILINTLSVKNYLHIVSHIQRQILAAGKKSYTFVVGKVNAAKLANFSEIGGWVVVGCWESSLLESRELFKPVVTPFELGLVLMKDEERVWTGEWVADFNSLLEGKEVGDVTAGERVGGVEPAQGIPKDNDNTATPSDQDSEPESAPPDFNLRTGRYASHSRPMQTPVSSPSSPQSTSLTKRHPTTLAAIAGEASPGAEYLRSQRTWRGLGSDFVVVGYEEEEEEKEKGARIEQGRSGIAGRYSVAGEEEGRGR
ncbi:MAG: Diphthamide biosynthesis protein 2 [Trichoglossum hirsutum]|nr:MAG: Diphthamide biosynthesis protein 2 [Trichoglossum hirsutum]